MYCVVETTEDGDKNCTAVPKIWVKENYLQWPVKKYDLIKGRRKCLQPGEDWTIMPCKILFDNISNWEDAVEKEQLSEYLSNSEGGEENIIQNHNEPLVLSTGDFNDLMSRINNDDIVVDSYDSQRDADQNVIIANTQVNCCPENHIGNIQFLKNEIIELKEVVLQHNAKMEVLLNLILTKLVPSKNNDYYENIFEYNSTKTSTDIENLEQKLRNDPSYKSDLAQNLSKFGGADASKTTRTIVKYLFEDESLMEYSWGGTKTKKSFSAFVEINTLILKAVRKIYPQYTVCDNANFFKEHLKHAKTRIARCNRLENPADN